MNDKLDTKKFLTKLLEQDGFAGVASTLGEIAKEQENLIRESNDADLACAFTYVFYILMDCFKGAGKKNKKQIKNVVKIDSVQEALKIVHWDSPNHCEAMKEAYQTIKAWEKEE